MARQSDRKHRVKRSLFLVRRLTFCVVASFRVVKAHCVSQSTLRKLTGNHCAYGQPGKFERPTEKKGYKRNSPERFFACRFLDIVAALAEKSFFIIYFCCCCCSICLRFCVNGQRRGHCFTMCTPVRHRSPIVEPQTFCYEGFLF